MIFCVTASIFSLFSLILLLATCVALIVYLTHTRHSGRTQWLVGLLIALPAVLIVVTWWPFGRLFLPDLTREPPNYSSLTGRYTSHDSRAPNAVLDLRANGTYILSGMPPGSFSENGVGSWQLRERESAGVWELDLSGPGNVPLRRQRPPYQIGLYIGDPDEGEVVFRK